jgi:cytochrome c nitrite reductase small subunit
MAEQGRGRSGLVLAAVAAGITIGLGCYTFVYAKGYSYLTNDPAACSNCHVMSDHYAAWSRGSHRAVATCNDCHTPPGFLPKYLTKARNGFWHSFYFTVGGYPDPLRITPRNHDVTEQACRKCHAELTASIEPLRSSASRSAQQLSCISCHRTVGHIE